MIPAIIEIFLLLLISCLIGVFFTHRYWKSKTKDIRDEIDELEEELEMRVSDTQKEKMEKKQLKTEQEKLEKKLSKTKKQKNEINALKSENESLQTQLDEKERELEALSRELDKKKVSYYKQIDGKRYKAVTLLAADEAVEGKGDGRISKEDAEKIFATVSDGQAYTQVEKDTMKYIRENYNWTDGADKLFRKKVRTWAAKDHILED